jgi:pyruvate/2-oxoglutarate dehydrogenase complex dihydrolipoamide acyltransferase (E2) component
MAPLEVLASSSPFGFRISPITGALGDFHLGQDFSASCGTRVYAADAGVVRAAGWHPWGGGNRVEIDHGNGLITTYNHLEAIAVRTGDTVQVGQVIARVGTTGWSTGCHLHFETILRGEHTSPLNWTLLPIRQVDELQAIAMVSYEGNGANGATAQPWAIPVAADNSHTVLNGEKELTAAPPVEHAETATTTTPSTTAPGTGTGTPSTTAPGTGTGTPSTTTPGTGTGTPSTTAPATGTATPTVAAPPPSATPTLTATTEQPAPTPTSAAPQSTPPGRSPAESERPLDTPTTQSAAPAPSETSSTPSETTATTTTSEPTPAKP